MNKVRAMFNSYPYITNVVGYTTLFATADLIQQSMLEGTHTQSTQLNGENSKEEASVIYKEEGALDQLEAYEWNKHSAEEKVVTNTAMHNINWSQTFRVALVGLCFHSNFNYHWLHALEKRFPGGGAKRISVKVLLDQLIAAPATISAFYIVRGTTHRDTVLPISKTALTHLCTRWLSALEGRDDPLEDWKNKFWTSYKTGVVYWSIMQAVNFSLVPPIARTVFVGGISLGWTVFLCHFRQQNNDSATSCRT